jgi:mannose-6-phosphate isomerase-like protein (cupin superfamily)
MCYAKSGAFASSVKKLLGRISGASEMDQEIILTKVDEIEWKTLSGGFKYKIVAQGEKFMTGIGVAQPGSGETWHKHTDEVEETYYVLKGEGNMEWKSEGIVNRIKFIEGDAMYLPFGVENQFVNTGDTELWLLFNITRAAKLRE